jgi:hypothetical protein
MDILCVCTFFHFLLSVERLSACDSLAVYIGSFVSMSHRLSKVLEKWRRKKLLLHVVHSVIAKEFYSLVYCIIAGLCGIGGIE